MKLYWLSQSIKSPKSRQSPIVTATFLWTGWNCWEMWQLWPLLPCNTLRLCKVNIDHWLVQKLTRFWAQGQEQSDKMSPFFHRWTKGKVDAAHLVNMCSFHSFYIVITTLWYPPVKCPPARLCQLDYYLLFKPLFSLCSAMYCIYELTSANKTVCWLMTSRIISADLC